MIRGVSREENTGKNQKFMQPEVKEQRKRASQKNPARKSAQKATNKKNNIGGGSSDKKEAAYWAPLPKL
jgi:hypothetical protein